MSLALAVAMLGFGATLGHAQTFVDPGFSTETVTTLPPYDAVGLTFAPDGGTLAAVDDSGDVTFWNVPAATGPVSGSCRATALVSSAVPVVLPSRAWAR